MTREDITQFGPRLVALADVFDTKLSESKIAAYFEALGDLDLDLVLGALRQATRVCKFFPRPVELRTLVLGEDEDAAELAWMAFKTAMRKAGSYASLVTADAALGETILSVFQSWPAACTVELSPEMWSSKRKEFGRVYRVCRQRGVSGHRYLPGICEQQNAGRQEWLKFFPVYRLEGTELATLSLEAADRARALIAAQAGFERLSDTLPAAIRSLEPIQRPDVS